MEQKAAIKNINNNNVQVFYADCCCLHNQILFDKFYNLLPDFRKKLVDNYVFQKDKTLSVGAWILLRYALLQNNINSDNVQYKAMKKGKPYICRNPIKFNLSHSGSICICSISNLEIGCDVEKIKTFKDNLLKMCLQNDEIEYLKNISDKKTQERCFYRYWTIKESFMKATGYGLYIKPIWIKVDLTKNSIEIEPNSKDLNIKSYQNYKYKELDIFENYCVSVCLNGTIDKIKTEQIDFNTLSFREDK